jgi:rod shape determining protein RodA
LAALFLVDVLFAPPGWQISLQPYQRNRLLVYFNRDYTHFASPGATPAELQRMRERQFNDSHNVRQALISVGSGGLTGKGWRQGTQNALGYLPRAVAHNDFIFSVIAEEKGFVGSVTVLTLYGVVLFTGLRIAGQARDRLGKVLAVGVVTLLFSHVFINIGMNILIMPVTGVPLPLLSGGSSVLGSLIAMGILQNVNIYRRGY